MAMGTAPGESVPACPYFPFQQQAADSSFLPWLAVASSQCLAGTLPGFALCTELQNSVQLCSDGGSSTRIQNPGFVPHPTTEAP